MEAGKSLVVTMPVYNESQGIIDFLGEIQKAFESVNLEFVIVNDASTDESSQRIRDFMGANGTPVHLITNDTNLGHGPSTLKGIDAAIATGISVVMTVDGDGQFRGQDLRSIYDLYQSSKYQVIEGIRTNRIEPVFRKVTTLITRLLVCIRCHKMPKDANTPLRIYSLKQLIEIRNGLSDKLLTPNLHISAMVRGKDLDLIIGELKVHSLPRRGTSTTGTMWRTKSRKLPSKRFIEFALKSLLQWVFSGRGVLGKRSQSN